MLVWSLLILLQQVLVQCQLNNACKNYQSYLNIYFSTNCYHIPDNEKNVSEIIEHHARVSETHQVTTTDGYILTLFRIPRKSPKGVILFQHGIAQDSSAWVTQYNESIALLFWENGYDIWLGNSRGSRYSRNHVKLKPSEAEYWDFDYHEMGYYDLNSTIDYIKKRTNVPKIFYVGHSMGAIAGVIYSSLRSEEAAESVKLMVLLAPVCYSQNSTSPLKTFAQLVHFYWTNNLHRLLRIYSFPEYDSLFLKLIRFFNKFFPFKYLYSLLISSIGGWSPEGFDPNYINLAVDQSGSGTALKIYAHAYQLTRPNVSFQMYDYGREGNLKAYGVENPPPYPLEDINVPIYTVYGQNDSISFDINIKMLMARLKPEVNFGKKEVKNFNHVDFVWGKHRNEAVYNDILKIFHAVSDTQTKEVCQKTSLKYLSNPKLKDLL